MSDDILDDLRAVQKLRGNTYSSYEVLGMVGRAATEIDLLRKQLDNANDALLEHALGVKRLYAERDEIERLARLVLQQRKEIEQLRTRRED